MKKQPWANYLAKQLQDRMVEGAGMCWALTKIVDAIQESFVASNDAPVIANMAMMNADPDQVGRALKQMISRRLLDYCITNGDELKESFDDIWKDYEELPEAQQ